jgi:mono/diheme cytochrome c family protein
METGGDMRFPRHYLTFALAGVALGLTPPAFAETPADFLGAFEREARAADPSFKAFSAERGRQFFQRTHGGEWSCASCHTENPAASGRHAKTAKTIAPLAPAANPERFASPAKVEKWFRRNCNDVLGRACTATEKGDVLTWLLTVSR